jgi:tetratricopeptide (TPR) repeat protein
MRRGSLGASAKRRFEGEVSRAKLIGRDTERAELAALVRQETWTTVVGLPGVGKTALAEAVVDDLGGADGLKHVVRVDARHGIDPVAVDAARRSRSPVLAIAYEPLGLDDEHVLRLRALSVPVSDAPPDAVLATAGVRALLAAARRVGAPILNPEDHAHVLGVIARRASGLPLVLEMAASHLPLLSLEALARQLTQPGSLAPAGRGRTQRHASVRAAFAPILDALPTDARTLLVGIAPHVRGVRVAPAASLTALRILVDRGLVEPVEARTLDQTWLRAPFVVGGLALELASPADERASRDAHLADVARRTLTAVRALRDMNDRHAARELAQLAEDVALATDHAENTGDEEQAISACAMALEHARAMGAVSPVLLARFEAWAKRVGEPASMSVRIGIERAAVADRHGDPDGALHQLRASEERGSEVEAGLRSDLLIALGTHLRDTRRDYGAARAAFDRAATTPDPLQRARALSGAGGSLTWAERYGEAVDAFTAARQATLGIEAPSMAAVIATNLAVARMGHWPSPRAARPRTLDVDDARSAARSFESIDDRHSACVAHQASALALVTLLRLEEARLELERMRDLARAVESRRYEAVAELDLGAIALLAGRLDEAEPRIARGLEIATVIEDRLLCGVAHGFVGDLAWERGELGRARESLGRARFLLEQDAEHASRLALVLAEEAALGGPSATALADRAASLVSDPSNVNWHAMRIYAALSDHRAGHASQDARVVPWLAAEVSLMGTPTSRRGGDGLGIPPAVALAIRRFVRALEPAPRRALLERAYGLGSPAGPTLLLDIDRRAVRAPDGRWTDLSRRERPFAVLEALAGTASTRWRTLPVTEILARVWPGEKMLLEAGANRVYAAAALLRKQPGLRDVIQSEGAGYRLAPQVDVLVYRTRHVPGPDTEPDTRG